MPKLIVEIKEELQRKMKHRIIDDGVTIKEFVTKALENELDKKEK